MEIFLDVVNVLTLIGVWIYVVWYGLSIKNLKSITDSLKNVFDTMKSSSEYLACIQNTAQKLYDPSEIEKIVNIRVQAKELEFQKALQKTETDKTDSIEEILSESKKIIFEVIDKHASTYMMFSAYATYLLNPQQLEQILDTFEDTKVKKEIVSFVQEIKTLAKQHI